MQTPAQIDLTEICALLDEYAERLLAKSEQILTDKHMPIEDRSAVWKSLQWLAHRTMQYSGYLSAERPDFAEELGIPDFT